MLATTHTSSAWFTTTVVGSNSTQFKHILTMDAMKAFNAYGITVMLDYRLSKKWNIMYDGLLVPPIPTSTAHRDLLA